NGSIRKDRTGTGTLGIFGYQMRFNLSTHLPVITTKKLHLKAVLHELIWFLKGDTDLKYLLENNINIWNDDAYNFYKRKNGSFNKEEFIEYSKNYGFDLGPIYGKQWRSWKIPVTSDQILDWRENGGIL